MENLYCNISDLNTESDVEQKFIYKFLTYTNPTGLDFNDSDIHTKETIKAYPINKGISSKNYVPDYLIVMDGIPIMVVEAKAPNENLEDGFAEARLYANEINAQFPHKKNICQKIICSNGNMTLYGYCDNNIPIGEIPFSNFITENNEFAKFMKFCSKNELKTQIKNFLTDIRGKAIFKSPISELGKVQDEELEENSYGRTLIFENRHVFDPETEEDKKIIVTNAYVKSEKREQHVEPIYSELKKMTYHLDINSTLIDTSTSTELVNKLHETSLNKERIINSLMLLIGNAGCGKSTFVRYFKEIILNKKYPETAKQFVWTFINMNEAPVSPDEIYIWIKNLLLQKIKDYYKDINFQSLSVLKDLFNEEIYNFENGLGALLNHDINKKHEELYNLLTKKNNDTTLLLKKIFKYISEKKLQIPIIVLDNCDKRTENEQLLMFQVSQWLKATFKCIVFMPMRNTTYEKYKTTPPIDTIVKDLTFRIDPADLLKVLQERLNYISRSSTNTQNQYSLSNGIQVTIQKKEQIEYFKAILTMIRNNKLAKTIFYQLSNGNIREAIQFFEDFCKSGHIKSEDIFNTKITEGKYSIPSYKLLNALIRKNRKYYNENFSNFTNLFFADNNDELPDPFVRIDILLFLKSKRNEIGHSGQKGYVKISEIISNLQSIGHKAEIIDRELKYLIKRNLIISENNIINSETYVIIASSGFLHLNLLSNIQYLAACAENMIYRNNEVMVEIANRLTEDDYLSRINSYKNVRTMYDYLNNYRKSFVVDSTVFLKQDFCSEIYNLEHIEKALETMANENPNLSKMTILEENYPKNTEITATVIHKFKNGYLCKIDNKDIRGYIVTYNNINLISQNNYLKEGNNIIVKIIDYNYKHKSFNLEFVKFLEN